ncbi:cytochrome P450 [Croceicoccus ponticola]|nr:cytochrome P450 [Croceicoccus ponticola]
MQWVAPLPTCAGADRPKQALRAEPMSRLLFDPTHRDVQIDPYPWYARLREEEPVHFIEPLNAWGLFRYEDCKNAFMHPELYSARDFIRQAFGDLDPVPETPSLIAMDPPDHTPLRKLTSHAFSPGVTRKMIPKIEAIVDGLLDEIQGRGRTFDFVNDFAAYIPVSVTAELLGVDPKQRENFKIWTADLLNAANRAALADEEVSRIRDSVSELRRYLEQVIRERREEPRDDFISMLIKAEEGGDTLTGIQVLSTAILTHFGGSETPSHLISSSLIAMFEQPEVNDAVMADRNLVPSLVDETLRYWSPVNLVFQTATCDIDLHDRCIPAGSHVLSYIGSANRDERKFKDADRFVLGRDPHGHLSFAHGPHYCPGASLGTRMASIAIAKVLERMPAIRKIDEVTDWLPSLWIRGARTLAVSA